jgi:hypothetical protein
VVSLFGGHVVGEASPSTCSSNTKRRCTLWAYYSTFLWFVVGFVWGFYIRPWSISILQERWPSLVFASVVLVVSWHLGYDAVLMLLGALLRLAFEDLREPGRE